MHLGPQGVCLGVHLRLGACKGLPRLLQPLLRLLRCLDQEQILLLQAAVNLQELVLLLQEPRGPRC